MKMCYINNELIVSRKFLFYVIFSLIGSFFNIILGTLVHHFNIPLYFDSIFTIYITIHFGLLPGILCALLTNLGLSILGSVLFPFIICSLSTVLISYFMNKRNYFNQFIGYIILGLCIALSNGILGSLIAFFFYGGVTKLHSIDKLVMGLLVTGKALFSSVFWAGMISNFTDKLISSILVSYIPSLKTSLISYFNKR